MKLKNLTALFLLLYVSMANGQITVYMDSWTSIGPNEEPTNPEKRSASGIGPIEFIRVFEKEEGYLLAGSLSGGLFFSENEGDSWINSGSDAWPYTGCAWADFYPENTNVWFACSHYEGDNGKPGRIGKKGGLYRTSNQGVSWEWIGGFRNFGGHEFIKIYGTRFHPNDPDLLFVLTSDGLYYTENCLEQFVKWKKVPNLSGWIYDLDFMDGQMYVSNFYHGKWNILVFNQDVYSSYSKIEPFAQEQKPMRNLTIEPKYGELLIAKDFVKDADELCAYNPKKDSLWQVLKAQKIGFGSGYTFAVSPYDSTEFYLGYSTQIRKYSYPDGKRQKTGRGYHVDIEFVAYDPFDSSKVYLATHGGVYLSSDQGATWESKSNNLGVAEVMGMAVYKQDPNQVAIGCYHDGSMVLADYEKNQNYTWRTVNGGDGLLPLIDPTNNAIVYTSNQFVGGGLYFSKDTAISRKNIHSLNNLKTAGWETATVLHPSVQNTVYFNFLEGDGENKGNINVCRSVDPTQRKNAEILSNFKKTHGLKKYKVYGLYNSPYHDDVLIAYVLHYAVDKDGKKKTNHLLFRTDWANGTPDQVINSWYQIRHPNNSWIGDVEIDGYNENRIYLSYTKGKDNPESIFGDKGMVYALQYRTNSKHSLKRSIDISKNVPNCMAGRYNLAYAKENGGKLFIATRNGVFLARGRALKGKSRWQKVGENLPHCKIYGLDYNEEKEVLTVGLFGRGVWQYYMK